MKLPQMPLDKGGGKDSTDAALRASIQLPWRFPNCLFASLPEKEAKKYFHINAAGINVFKARVALKRIHESWPGASVRRNVMTPKALSTKSLEARPAITFLLRTLVLVIVVTSGSSVLVINDDGGSIRYNVLVFVGKLALIVLGTGGGVAVLASGVLRHKIVDDKRVTFSKVGQSARKTMSSSPRRAQYLLLLIPKKDREHLIGDLEEEFRTLVLPQYGRRRANFYYWWHACAAIAPYILRFFKHARE
jgi:hypothetical protein